ncbi:secretion system protein [Candidatus Saccharibacteria bacterium RIFCSPHIGHO2_02_FULL_47_12]|nr:MAG: secretion system protein [Candidatus Saccharibacteria bacterium RIFCSPHIGHO2_02_FULL_47_12]
MPTFAYIALTKDGKALHGNLQAASQEAAMQSLTKQGLRPIALKPSSAEKSGFLSKLKLGKKVKLKDLVVFTRQLSTMISAGVPLTRSLATLQDEAENKYFKSVIAGISKDVEGGMPLADAFARHPTVFSEVYTNMVRAGEAGGILDDILKRLASQVEQDASIRKKVKGAMMYPIVILSVSVVAFFGIMIFIIPKIAKIMEDLGGPNAKLPVYTRAMITVSGFVQHNSIFILVGLGIAFFLLRKYIKTPGGRHRFHLLLLNLPIIKTVVVKVSVARFSRTFASLTAAGVSVLESLNVTGRAMGNVILEDELKAAATEVKNGKQLSEPISGSKYFPRIVSQMLAVGEETGQIDTILVKVADFYEEEVNTLIDSLASIIEPLMIIVLGAFVGLIAASVMGPIAGLSKNISGG